MVTVVDYVPRKAEEGDTFYALILQGGVEVVTSQTGSSYLTARKTSIPSTFDEATCKLLIGSQLPGRIDRVACEPYEYTNPKTGEVVLLSHSYQYVPDHVTEAVLVPDEQVY